MFSTLPAWVILELESLYKMTEVPWALKARNCESKVKAISRRVIFFTTVSVIWNQRVSKYLLGNTEKPARGRGVKWRPPFVVPPVDVRTSLH